VLAADALPPLAPLHECVMNEATAAKQRVGCSFSISPQALEASLGALWPQLQEALDTDRKVGCNRGPPITTTPAIRRQAGPPIITRRPQPAALLTSLLAVPQAKLLEALQELRVSEPDVSFLAPQYLDVLRAADQKAAAGAGGDAGPVAAAGNKQSQAQDHGGGHEQRVERASAKIRELFMDYCRLAGLGSAKQRMAGLEQLLGDRQTEAQQVLGYMLGAAA
jgi:Bardet-Biedl syndrome 7 protein